MLKQLIRTLFVYLCLVGVCRAKLDISIGAIFHEKNSETEIAFLAAIYSINILDEHIHLVPVVRYVVESDSFRAEKIVCELGKIGVAAIFGPFSKSTIGIVESVSNKFGVPLFIAQWTPDPLTDNLERPHNLTINLYPDSSFLAKAHSDFVIDSEWKAYTILYEDDYSLMKIKDILQIHGPEDKPIPLVQLAADYDFRPLLKNIQNSGTGTFDLVVDCSIDKILPLLKQAKDLLLINKYQRIFMTSLDTHSVPFEQLELEYGNITTLRMLDIDNDQLAAAVNDWRHVAHMNNVTLDVVAETAKLVPSLMFDAVKIFTTVLKTYLAKNRRVKFNIPQFDCSSYDQIEEIRPWKFGKPLIDEIKFIAFRGITGKMIFDEYGRRKEFDLDILEFSKPKQFRKIADWSSSDGIKYTRTEKEIEEEELEQYANRKLRVVSKLGKPFLMLRENKNGTIYQGNAQYEGYVMDLLEEIMKNMNCTYEVELVPDNQYGMMNPKTKEWNGVVRYIMDRKADIGVFDLTINYERRTVIDFTMPFMTLGISILYTKPAQEEKNLFSFLLPFSPSIWSCIALAVFVLTLLIYVLGRMSDDEWENPHPCKQESEERQNPWNLKNCTWLVIGTLMGQGCDILPKGVSIRLVCGMWWFFALIMLSSYTANMAAFLTMERMGNSIESVEQLAEQSKIKYGCVSGGSTKAFFETSSNPLYQKMWAVMAQSKPSVFCSNNDECVDRVSKSKHTFAFFVESSVLEYITERNCDLTQIGKLLDTKGYGIGMPMDSKLRKPLNEVILKLQEHGKLDGLKKRWWKELRGGGKCNTDSKPVGDTEKLDLENVGGVFVVLAGGCIVGLLTGFLEFLWNVKDIAVEKKLTPGEALKQEIKFAFNISARTKPVMKPISESPYSHRSFESFTPSPNKELDGN